MSASPNAKARLSDEAGFFVRHALSRPFVAPAPFLPSLSRRREPSRSIHIAAAGVMDSRLRGNDDGKSGSFFTTERTEDTEKFVMRGLDPRIHDFIRMSKAVDSRIKSGHDGLSYL